MDWVHQFDGTHGVAYSWSKEEEMITARWRQSSVLRRDCEAIDEPRSNRLYREMHARSTLMVTSREVAPIPGNNDFS
jgi:hypothetical protein